MKQREDFLQEAMRYADWDSKKTAARAWQAFLETIIRQIYFTGKCNIPGLGIITTKKIKGGYQTDVLESGRVVEYFIPDKIAPHFTPNDDFINDINGVGVTKKYLNRLQAGTMSQADFIRLKRQELLETVARQKQGEETKSARRDDMRADFLSLLQNKREQAEQDNQVSQEKAEREEQIRSAFAEELYYGFYPENDYENGE